MSMRPYTRQWSRNQTWLGRLARAHGRDARATRFSQGAEISAVNYPESWKLRSAVLILLISIVIPIVAEAQEISVQNEASTPVKITAAEIAAMPHQKMTVDDHGKSVVMEGVPLRQVLEKAGVTFDKSMHGKSLSRCLLVEAADGYRVVFSLAELDPGFTDRVILLADRADGQPLDSKTGPFRVVVPGEKRMARWVRQVTGLKVVQIQ